MKISLNQTDLDNFRSICIYSVEMQARLFATLEDIEHNAHINHVFDNIKGYAKATKNLLKASYSRSQCKTTVKVIAMNLTSQSEHRKQIRDLIMEASSAEIVFEKAKEYTENKCWCTL